MKKIIAIILICLSFTPQAIIAMSDDEKKAIQLELINITLSRTNITTLDQFNANLAAFTQYRRIKGTLSPVEFTQGINYIHDDLRRKIELNGNPAEQERIMEQFTFITLDSAITSLNHPD